MCPERSWNILLASALVIFVLLISFMKRREGSDESMNLNLAERGDPLHSLLHFANLAAPSS